MAVGCTSNRSGVLPRMTTAPVDTTAVVLDRHLQAFGSRDLDGALADYADDARVFTPFGLVRREGLAEFLKGIFAEFGKPPVPHSI